MPCAPRMTGCKASCLHRQLVEAHRDDMQVWEALAEAASNGWATEYAEFKANNPPPTFKARLKALKRPDPPQEVTPWPTQTGSLERSSDVA